MRKEYAKLLYNEMKKNKNIIVLTADLGFGILDDIKNSFSDRFYNVGAAEQLMIGTAIGLAESNKIPICYSITPFLLYRPFEFLRNYVNYEKINIKLVGAGRDKDYSHDGISHWAEDDEIILKSLPNIKIYKPNSLVELANTWENFIYSNSPSYLNLKRN
jgi:transketolase